MPFNESLNLDGFKLLSHGKVGHLVISTKTWAFLREFRVFFLSWGGGWDVLVILKLLNVLYLQLGSRQLRLLECLIDTVKFM